MSTPEELGPWLAEHLAPSPDESEWLAEHLAPEEEQAAAAEREGTAAEEALEGDGSRPD